MQRKKKEEDEEDDNEMEETYICFFKLFFCNLQNIYILFINMQVYMNNKHSEHKLQFGKACVNK